MRVATATLSFVLLLLTGCRLPEDDLGIVRVVWNEFPWWSVVWRLGFWTLLGAALGLLIGVGFSLLLRRWGCYRLPWPRVRYWLALLLFAVNIVAMPLFFGTVGFFEGLYRASEVGLRHSVIGTEWLPKIGAVAADAILFADALLDKEELPDWDAIQQQKRPLDVPRFLDRVDRLKEDAAARISAKAKEKLFEQNPDWQGDVAETVIDWTLPYLLRYLINHKLNRAMKEHGIHDFLGEMRVQAGHDGNGQLTHAELTAFLTECVLIPMLLYPLRHWVLSTQAAMLGIACAVFAAPLPLLWLARRINFWWQRRQIRRVCGDRV